MDDTWIGGRLAPLLRPFATAADGDGASPVTPEERAALLRRSCELVVRAKPALVEAAVTVRLDGTPGAALALLRTAELVAGEFGLRTGMQIHSAGHEATIHLWAERLTSA